MRCRVHTSLIPPLFGAWPRGSVEMVSTSVPPTATEVWHSYHKTYMDFIPAACTCQIQIDPMFGCDVRQHLLAYRRASAPQGRSRCISPFQHTCTNRNPPGSLSFGPRRNDRAEWTTTRHIDLTLSISPPMFFPSLAGRRLLCLVVVLSRLVISLLFSPVLYISPNLPSF